MHEFHFHEDDVGQIQIMPMANRAYCERELKALAEHSEEHLAPGGVGWTEMYEFSADEESLSDTETIRSLDITETRFGALLLPHSKKFDRLVSPLSEIDAQLGFRSIGFGPGRRAGVIAELEGDYVKSIWCMFSALTADGISELSDLLTALSQDHHLLLVDWLTMEIVDLRVRQEIDRYLKNEA